MAQVVMNVTFEYEGIPKYRVDDYRRYFMEAQNMMADLCNDHLERWNKDFDEKYGDVDTSKEPMYSTYNGFINKKIESHALGKINNEFKAMMSFELGSECQLIGHVKNYPGSYITIGKMEMA